MADDCPSSPILPANPSAMSGINGRALVFSHARQQQQRSCYMRTASAPIVTIDEELHRWVVDRFAASAGEQVVADNEAVVP